MEKHWVSFVLLSCIIIKAHSQGSLGPCTCDLTRYACDTNCCCDTDCTTGDRQAFSNCIATYTYENALSCSQAAVLYSNFSAYTSNTTSSDLFCVYFDRYSSRNYYVVPTVDTTSATGLSSAIAAYQTMYRFGDVTSGLDPASLRSAYKTNVPVQVMYANNKTGFLAHPSAANSPLCSYASPALFLDSSASQCAHQVTSDSCATDSAISLASFVDGFRVASQPSVLDSEPDYNKLVRVVQASVQCLNASDVSFNCTADIPAPSVTGSNCVDVLSQLTYSIKYVSGTGITEVSYDAVLRTVPVTSPYTLQQEFSFYYNSNSSNSTDAFPRSGNPGYLVGRPLIAGNASGTPVKVNSNPSRWVTIPAVNSDGSCGSSGGSSSQSVLFGEDVRASCTRSLGWNATAMSISTTCDSLNNEIRASLYGLGGDGNMSLAMFGNSSVSMPGDWLPVLPKNPCAVNPKRAATACTDMILGARLDVLFARAGSMSAPQSKLVGARLSCDFGDVIFQCAAGSCQSSSSVTKFLTTYTVSFIDVSTSPLVGAKQRPVYLLRLPTDFFYPLYTYSGAHTIGSASARLWLLCLAAFYWLARTL